MNETLAKVGETLMGYVAKYGLDLVAAIVIFIVGKWLARVITNLIEKAMVKSKVDSTLVKFVKNLVYMGLLAFVVIAAVNKLGVQTTSFIAVLGAAGLAIGLALQGSLSNFASGVILIMFKPFKVGDFIEAGGVLGSVVEIQIFNTMLDHPDNRRIIVPNAQITGGTITNFSAIEKRRIDLVFGISYDDDMKKAKNILEKIVTEDARILKDPAPVIAVSELADSSVNIVCRPFVKPGDYWAVRFDVTEKAKEQLEKNGISIPFPQTDIHVYENKVV
ncbi:MAG: mechanosensitive ion channel [Candidatus Aureabacteria bacterium]|nr:mechanosensitive ion channel [Candidatus Auribacterota bacterium]